MDILDKLLTLAQISAGVNVKCELQGDWRLNNPEKRGQALLHIVLRGRAYLYFPENHDESRWLQAGDMVFLPRSTEHYLQSDCDEVHDLAVPMQAQRGFMLKRFEADSGTCCEFFCLHYQYDEQAMLMESLADVVQLSLAETSLTAVVELLQAESQSALNEACLGTASMVNGLALVVLTLMLRNYLSQPEIALLGILRGSQEPRLRDLLNALLHAPEVLWSLESMADFAHVSRSKLTRLFKEHLGISPHVLVHRLRLQKGAMLLRQRADAVLSIALATGFQSEAHFSKAFKKRYGMRPRAYRLIQRDKALC